MKLPCVIYVGPDTSSRAPSPMPRSPIGRSSSVPSKARSKKSWVLKLRRPRSPQITSRGQGDELAEHLLGPRNSCVYMDKPTSLSSRSSILGCRPSNVLPSPESFEAKTEKGGSFVVGLVGSFCGSCDSCDCCGPCGPCPMRQTRQSTSAASRDRFLELEPRHGASGACAPTRQM